MRLSRFFATLLGLLALTVASSAQTDGIFADFQTTMGNFTARLDYGNSPATVANFIGLAEGSRAHIDVKTGAVVTGKPYYNGIIFHRVISGFMNQTGCPLGNGSAGPGYQIRDELANGLSHNQPYLLSMANSGPNTGGSQFFITVEPTPWLDGKHSIFGSITSGSDVIDDINGVTVINERPVTDVVIQAVTIRRVGAAAQAFNINSQNLPTCHGSGGSLMVNPGVSVVWNFASSLEPGSIFAGYKSADLASWTKLGQIFRQPQDPPYTSVTMEFSTSARGFYLLSEARHPGACHTATDIPDFANRTLTLAAGNVTYFFVFDATGAAGLGTRIEGLLGTPFQFEFPTWLNLNYYTPSPYGFEMVLYSNLDGYLKILGGYDSAVPTQQAGRHVLNYYNFDFQKWQEMGHGMMTLSN